MPRQAVRPVRARQAALLAAIDGGCVVLVRSRRAAHALRLAYAEHAIALGRKTWTTPEVLTPQAWAERLWRSLPPALPRDRLLSTAQTQVLWERIVTQSPVATALLNPASAARSAARSWELALHHDMALADVAAFDSDETLAFTGWAREFERECRSRRWMPPVLVLAQLAERSELPPVRLQLALGEPPTPLEKRLLSRIEASGGHVGAEPAAGPSGITFVFEADDAEHELRRAAAWAREQVSLGASTVGIVVPDLEARRRTVRHVLEDQFVPVMRLAGEQPRQVPFAIAASGPLAGFPLVRTALDLLSLVHGERRMGIAGRLLRSPFIAGFAVEASSRALFDAQLRTSASDDVDVTTLARQAHAAGCPLLGAQLSALRQMQTEAVPARLPSDWATWFLQAWSVAGWPGDRTADSVEQQTRAKLNEALSSFGSLDDLLGPLPLERAVPRFLQWISATAFEPESPATVVQVIDPDSVAGMAFEALWVTGCDASSLPPSPAPDPFLPWPLQRQCGVPHATAAGCREDAERRLRLLRGAADTVVLSWAAHVDEAEQTLSPLLADIPVLDGDGPPTVTLAMRLQQQAPLPETLFDDSAPAVPPGPVSGGTQLVELQSLCPFRAQAELRLGARPLERRAAGIDPRERGKLLHRALEQLWSELGSQSRLLGLDETEIRQRVFATLERLSVPLLAGASPHRARLLRIEVDIATRKLCELLRLERLRAPFAVVDRPEQAVRYASAGLTLELRIDRIDALDDGSEIIVDYKTGKSAQAARWRGDRPEQPQLPLYAVARRDRVAAISFALLDARDTAFVGIARTGDMLPGVPASEVEWPVLLQDWQRVVDSLIGAYARGDATVDPLPQACGRCHLAGFCRIHDSAGPFIDDGADA